MAQSPLPCADLSPPPAWCPTAGTARQALRAPPLPPVLFLLLLTTHQRLAPQPSHCSACLPPFLRQWTERGRCFLPVSPLLPRSCPHWLPRAGRCLPLAVPHPELPSRIAFTPRPTMADGGWGLGPHPCPGCWPSVPGPPRVRPAHPAGPGSERPSDGPVRAALPSPWASAQHIVSQTCVVCGATLLQAYRSQAVF